MENHEIGPWIDMDDMGGDFCERKLDIYGTRSFNCGDATHWT